MNGPANAEGASPPGERSRASAAERFSTNAAIWLITVLFALFVAVLGLLTYQGRHDAQKRAEDRALAGAQVVGTNTRWIVELSQQALRRIDESLGENIDGARSNKVADLREAVDALPGSVRAYVVGADGQPLYSTVTSELFNVAGREYFDRLVQGEQWYVSALLVSAQTGNQVFVFSRRLERNGVFVGAAIIAFDVLLLREIWASLELDSASAISILRDDAQLVARYPLSAGPLDLRDYVLFTDYLPKADQGVFQALSPADGVWRFVGYQRLPGTKLIAVSSVSEQAAFAQFWRNTWTMLVLAFPGALALGAAAIWIGQLLRRDAQRQVDLARAIETNQLLFRDIHHRVKNNLQSVQSLVRMQAIPADVKMDLQRRIAAMTAVHEHIYRLDQYVEVSAKTLIPAIVEPLILGFGQEINVEFDIDPIDIERDSATPLALLVNELVTNALKYAFVDGRAGAVRIALKASGDSRAVLTVSDNGVGYDTSAPMTGMGSRLIKAMATQMGGTPSYAFEGGTTFTADLAVRSPHYPSTQIPKLAAE